jgi:MFS transporter, OFA family, oxalate/formate antiporter
MLHSHDQKSENMKAVLAILGSCAAIFWPGALTFGYPGVMAPIWQQMFHVGRGAAGLTIFFTLSAVGVFMFLVGRWQERYGIRRMIALGIVLTALASLIAASAQSMLAVYAWAFLNGLASCFVYIPALTLVQLWYLEKKGLACGIVSMVFGLAAAIMSPLFAKMLTSFGYSSMNILIAALTLIFGVSGAYFARAPASFEQRHSSFVEISNDTRSEIKGVDFAGHEIRKRRSLTVQESLHTRSFWFLWIVWTLAGAAGVSMTILSTSYGLSRGFSLESAILILTAFNMTNGLGRLISGYFSDRIGRTRTMSMAFLAAGLAYFGLSFASSLLACSFLAAIIGFSFGTLFSVSAPLLPNALDSTTSVPFLD